MRKPERPVGRTQTYYPEPPLPGPNGTAPRSGLRTRPAWRALQLSCLALSALALAGYWTLTNTSSEVRRAALLSAPGEAPHFTLLLAGRDIVYCYYRVPCADQNSRKVYQPPNTDTIMLVKVAGTRVSVLSIPRDTNVGPYNPGLGISAQKVNSRYWAEGPEGLARATEAITGERVDSYAVVRTDYVSTVIDALGGLDVTVPDVPSYGDPKRRGLHFDDVAADLHVHLDPGPHHLDGRAAVAYLRMRKGFGDDYGRMDHQKQALSQLVGKLRGPGGLAALPTLLRGLSSGSVETNLDPAIAQQLLPFLHDFKLSFATLPTVEIPGTSNLAADREALAKVWGDPALAGPATPDSALGAAQPPAKLHIFDASGQDLGARLAWALAASGHGAAQVTTEPRSQQNSQVFTLDQVPAAEAVADVLNLPRLQGLRFQIAEGEVGIYLGTDAVQKYAALTQLPTPSLNPASATP